MRLRLFKKYFWASLVFLLVSCTTTKKIAQETLLHQPFAAQATLGIAIFDLEKEKIKYVYASNKLLVPASNVKIVTNYIALKLAGDSIRGAKIKYTDTAILIQLYPDPTLLHPNFTYQPLYSTILQTSKKIYLSLPNFSTTKYGKGWALEDYNEAFMPERSAVPIYGNTVTFGWNNNQLKSNLHWDALTNKTLANTHYKIDRSFIENYFFVTPSNKPFSTQTLPFVTSITNSLVLLGDTTKKIFLLQDSFPEFSGEILYSHKTTDLLSKMMRQSDNFLAEQLCLYLSYLRINQMNETIFIDSLSGTLLKGFPQQPVWVDGSGLSRYNLFSPEDFIFILNKTYKEFDWKTIAYIYPTAGEGTLKNLFAGYKGKIYAKTGSMKGIFALSGYLISKKNKYFSFSILINNFNLPVSAVKKSLENFIIKFIEKN